MSFGLATHFTPYRPPAPTGVYVSRSAATGASLSAAGSLPNFSITLGSAPPAGVWLILITTTNTGQGAVSSGGSAWTTLYSGIGSYIYYKKAGASEPGSYTVYVNGSAKSDGGTAVLIEVTNANATNPDAANYTASSTATPPTATSSNAGDLAVLTWTGSLTLFSAAPTGYTLNQAYNQSKSNGSVALASLANCGSGTITPPHWQSSGSDVPGSPLATFLFKP